MAAREALGVVWFVHPVAGGAAAALADLGGGFGLGDVLPGSKQRIEKLDYRVTGELPR